MPDNRCVRISDLKRKIKYHPEVGTYVSEEDIDLAERVFCGCSDAATRLDLINEREKIPFPFQYMEQHFLGAISFDRAIDKTIEEVDKLIAECVETHNLKA